MKRTLWIILLIGIPMWVLADEDYQAVYCKGLSAYKKGNYETAREHFMNVLEQKVYSNVVSYIRLCNEKIDEQHKEAIELLKKEKQEEINKNVEVNTKRIELNKRLSNLNEEKKALGKERDNLQKQLENSTLQNKRMRHQIDSLQTITANIKPKELEKIIKKIQEDNQKDNK